MHLNLHASDEELTRIAKVEERKDRITNSVVMAILLVLTAGVAYWIYAEHVRAVRLNTQGQKIKGTLDDEYTKVTRTKTGEVRYEVKYSFMVGDSTYHGEDTIQNRPSSDYAIVVYDPTDPNNNKLEGAEPFSSNWAESLTLVVFAYIVAGIRFLYRKYQSRPKAIPSGLEGQPPAPRK